MLTIMDKRRIMTKTSGEIKALTVMLLLSDGLLIKVVCIYSWVVLTKAWSNVSLDAQLFETLSGIRWIKVHP